MRMISTNDKLPENMQKVLFYGDGEYEIGVYTTESSTCSFFGRDAGYPLCCVTHWFPLPVVEKESPND